jgi:hypothetical protein
VETILAGMNIGKVEESSLIWGFLHQLDTAARAGFHRMPSGHADGPGPGPARTSYPPCPGGELERSSGITERMAGRIAGPLWKRTLSPIRATADLAGIVAGQPKPVDQSGSPGHPDLQALESPLTNSPACGRLWERVERLAGASGDLFSFAGGPDREERLPRRKAASVLPIFPLRLRSETDDESPDTEAGGSRRGRDQPRARRKTESREDRIFRP